MRHRDHYCFARRFAAAFAVSILFMQGSPRSAFGQFVIDDTGTGVDWRQDANEDPTLGDAHWISGMLNSNNSLYYEGMSVPARLIFVDIDATTDDEHALEFKHAATKNNIHAYDYMTSWDQALVAADTISPGEGLLANLVAQACGPDIGPQASTEICNALRGGPNVLDVDIPDTMGSIAGDDIDASIAAYEAALGNRVIRIYGNEPITSGSLTFHGFALVIGDDKDAEYTLSWTSASDQILIEIGGHLAVGPDNAVGMGIGYGEGRGASSISGGPYHMSLTALDGHPVAAGTGLAILGADILLPFCVNGITEPGGLCYDGNDCTTDECDEINDVCVHNPKPLSTPCENDFNLCTIDHCNGQGDCVYTGNDVECQDPVPPCEGGEYCAPATGQCNALPDGPLSTACDSDDNLCTGDHCDGAGNCVPYAPYDVVCQDPDPPCEGGQYCEPTTGQCVNYPDADLSTPCEADGNLCTIDHCNGNGACVTYDNVVCQDPDPPCEGGQYCEPTTGQCVDHPDADLSTPCEADGDLCTIDHCDGNGGCVTYDNVVCQDPNPPCEGGQYCEPTTGQCVDHPDADLSTPCEADGNLCTIDHCDGNGACVTYDNVVCQDPDPPCEGGQYCEPTTGQCVDHPDADLSTPCEADGDLCTIDHCDGNGACVTYDNVVCQDADPPCEGGQYCEPTTGQCVDHPDADLSTPCEADGDLCTIDHCNGSGACVTYDNVVCQEANPPCEGGQYCESTTGQCVDHPDADLSTPCEAETPPNLCTIDHCDGNGACVTYDNVECEVEDPPCGGGQYCEPATGQCVDYEDAPLSTPCETDGNLCTIDHCDGNGACVTYDNVVCQDPNPPCEGGQYCEPTTGQCVDHPDADLSTPCEADGDLCTIDHCDGNGGCVTYDNVVCQDPNPPCEGGQYCEPTTGQCVDHPDADLSTPCEADGNLCTIDHCNGNGACVTYDNVVCQDADPPCEGGQYCESTTGQCVDHPDADLSTPCEADGDLCTIDHCDGNGACVTYDNVVCQEADPPCEGGQYCEPTTGQCVDHPDADLSTPCEADGDLCTIDHCDGNGTCVTYDNVVCQEANPPCEGGQHCEPTTGECVDDPDADLSTPCEADGDLCTNDHCDGNGNCVWLSDVDCSYLDDQCNDGVCDPATGECSANPKPESTPCENDFNLCTIEHCNGQGDCVYTGNDVECQDPVPPCEGGEYCEPATGQCNALPDGPLSTPCEADGDLCTIDHCDGNGSCVNHDDVVCQDPDPPCEGGQYCEPTTGQCVNYPDADLSTPCEADGDLCTIDHCNGNGTCVTYDNVVCQDPDPPCEGGQYCEPTTGQCVDHPDADLSTPCEADGGNLCTIDHCDGNGACVTYDNVVCQDPNPPCEGGQYCEPTTGQCVDHPDADLSTPCEADGDLCTIDHCDGNGVCVTYDNVVCQDPNPPCDGGQYCEPTTGQCVDHPDADLSTPCEADGDPCTGDHCDGNGQCVFDSYVCGACCLPDGSCQDNMTATQCTAVAGAGAFRGADSVCLGDGDGNGMDDCCEAIPTVSEWGLLILALLLLTLGKVCFGRRQWAWGEQ